jgi:hypothetical protein
MTLRDNLVGKDHRGVSLGEPNLINVLSSVLSLVLSVASASSLSVDKVLSVLGELNIGNSDVRSVDWDSDGLSVWLVLGDLLNVEAVSQSVNLSDLALLTLPGTVHNLDFVVFSDRERLDFVLLSEVLGEDGAHQSVFQVRRSGEVGLSCFSSAAGDSYIIGSYLDGSSLSGNFIIK